MTSWLTTLTVNSWTVQLRRATVHDVPRIVGLLADDQLGRSRDVHRDTGDLAPYLQAFEVIDADPAQLLVVAIADNDIVGTLQLSFIPGLARRGALRAQLEAVRVAASHRSRGLGAAMCQWAIDQARSRGCAVVQLTSDKARTDAHRFYQQLGFAATHEGFKLLL